MVLNLPGHEILPKTVHVSRLRPFTVRTPPDDPQAAAVNSEDDFEQELEDWKTATLRRKAPGAHWNRKASGVRPIMFRRFANEEDPEEEANPHYRVDHLIRARFSSTEDTFEYRVRWHKWNSNWDTWEPEEGLHPELIREFWAEYKNKNAAAKALYVKYQRFQSQRGHLPRTTPSKPVPTTDTVTDDAPFTIELPGSGETPVVRPGRVGPLVPATPPSGVGLGRSPGTLRPTLAKPLDPNRRVTRSMS